MPGRHGWPLHSAIKRSNVAVRLDPDVPWKPLGRRFSMNLWLGTSRGCLSALVVPSPFQWKQTEVFRNENTNAPPAGTLLYEAVSCVILVLLLHMRMRMQSGSAQLEFVTALRVIKYMFISQRT